MLFSTHVFRPGLLNPNPFPDLVYLSHHFFTRAQTTRFKKIPFEFAYCSFFDSLGPETINTFTRSHGVSSKAIPDSRPKWAKSIPVFRPKRHKNPSLWGGTYLCGLYKGGPPPPGWCQRIYPTRMIRLSYIMLRFFFKRFTEAKHLALFKSFSEHFPGKYFFSLWENNIETFWRENDETQISNLLY